MQMHISTQPCRRHGASLAFGILGSSMIAACAGTPPAPTAALNAAHVAITEAERVDAGHYAGDALTEARAKLELANADVAAKRMIPAERLANESRTEAELAAATTGAMKAKAVNADMQRSNSTLIDEMQRNAGDTK
jgi:hypothetical protein